MKEKIKKIINQFNTRSPFEIAQALKITVLYSELPACTKGICYSICGAKIILINDSLNRVESAAVCAHELGHFLLHPELNIQFMVSDTFFVEGRLEKEADMFAAELLIDENELCLPEYENFSVAQLSTALGVSERLIKIKLSL